MADNYSNNQRPNRNSGQRPQRPSSEAARRRAAAERERQRKQRQRIRTVTIVIAIIVVVAIVVIIAVSCSHNKNKEVPKGSSAVLPTQSSETNDSSSDGSSSTADIPQEYVAATVSHDEIAVTDDDPIQGTDGSYSIRVNTALNAVTVYDANGNPVRVLACSTGRRDGHETPEGTFTLGEWIILPWNEWCYMADGTEGLYAYRIIDGINNDIMFHSVPYFETDHGTLEYEEYNKLGDYASMGCIRMCTADCRWLGELCATGTEVIIYYDENEQLPMEKPTPIRIPVELEQVRGWDPTDPISSNPWHSYTIDLQVPNSVTVEKGADYYTDPVLAEATAKDNFGNDLANYITYSGIYDSYTEGTYTVRVSCDVGPSHAYKDVYVVVK
ncbi:MAG: L,D-transpeptidase [Parasporobacterium sp.]|nr:L,D-transpeptidase [Parasporobacterium sp.]